MLNIVLVAVFGELSLNGDLFVALVLIAAGAVRIGISALDHKLVYDPVEGKSVVEALAYKLKDMLYGQGCGGRIKNKLDLTVILYLDGDICKLVTLDVTGVKVGAILLTLRLKGCSLGLYGFAVVGKDKRDLIGKIGVGRLKYDRGKPSVLGKFDHHVLVEKPVHRDRGAGVLVGRGAVLKAIIAILEGEIHAKGVYATLRDPILVVCLTVNKVKFKPVGLIEHRAVICILGKADGDVIKNERCLPYLLGNGGVFSVALSTATFSTALGVAVIRAALVGIRILKLYSYKLVDGDRLDHRLLGLIRNGAV